MGQKQHRVTQSAVIPSPVLPGVERMAGMPVRPALQHHSQGVALQQLPLVPVRPCGKGRSERHLAPSHRGHHQLAGMLGLCAGRLMPGAQCTPQRRGPVVHFRLQQASESIQPRLEGFDSVTMP